ncbi:tetratricopeptide repeat protein [Aquabacterium sp. J223]|uniref:tetratricopeptide repeat protein n=1 Tax=Aquabacterium sp. J223 TaxID=2898431 RepID=UPI0021AE0443|nr:tetratricopeptide repeat protein [Aquabacterium sp. J223]UUX95218.1 tetratricopeptide repeat protein [Aquabacterium sp. J223]
MSTAAAATVHTLKSVEGAVGIPRAMVLRLISRGYVVPAKGRRGQYLFSFQDLVLLRSAHGLLRAGVPASRVVQALARLREQLPSDLPLSGLRVTAVGGDIAVRDAASPRSVVSGQLLLDFEVEARDGAAAQVVALSSPDTDGRGPSPPAPAADPRDLVVRGAELEHRDPVAAEAAYRQALQLDRCCTDAYLGLGTLLSETDRDEAAVALYQDGLRRCADKGTLHFNLALVLEDLGRLTEAAEQYERCLETDPTFADAHHNAALLYERLGEGQRLIRHLNAYRRLTRGT